VFQSSNSHLPLLSCWQYLATPVLQNQSIWDRSSDALQYQVFLGIVIFSGDLINKQRWFGKDRVGASWWGRSSPLIALPMSKQSKTLPYRRKGQQNMRGWQITDPTCGVEQGNIRMKNHPGHKSQLQMTVFGDYFSSKSGAELQTIWFKTSLFTNHNLGGVEESSWTIERPLKVDIYLLHKINSCFLD